jgi:FkbM family methyltransferase
MIDFSKVPSDTVLGRLLRLPLKLIPDSLVVKVIQGENRGLQWIVGSATHGCWPGSFEAQKQKRVAEILPEGGTFYDIGANVGFYTLLASRVVGENGRVISFEPNPRNLEFLQKHVQLNDFGNVCIYALALANQEGWVGFSSAKGPAQGRIDENSSLKVVKTPLDRMVQREDIPEPDVLKIDIEGAESAMLEGARKTLSSSRPVVFVATHGQKQYRESIRILEQLGYRLEGVGGESVMNTDEIIGLPE